MKAMRTLIRCVVTLTLAAFALPGFGANSNNKTYQIDMTVLQQGSGTAPSQVQAVISNTSPSQSTSTISSIDIFVDLGWTIINSKNDPAHAIDAYESNAPTKKYAADTSQAGHIKITHLSPLKPVSITGTTLVVKFWVTMGSSGDGSWNANPYSGAQLNGNTFARNGGQNIASVATSALACSESFPVGAPVPGPAGSVYATRGLNKDGSGQTLEDAAACDAFPYFASDTTGNNVGLTQDLLHFRWDQVADSPAAFLYTIFYSSPPPSPLQVGWLDQQGNLAVNPGVDFSNVARLDAPTCIGLGSADPALPSPLGHLTNDIDDSSTTLKALFTPPLPSPFPFAIVVGTERMNVTGPGPNVFSWTVERGALMTQPAAHFQNDIMMSTPLQPIPDGAPPPYVAGAQAQMCAIAGTVEYHQGDNGPVIRYSKQIIDIGDGWVLGR